MTHKNELYPFYATLAAIVVLSALAAVAAWNGKNVLASGLQASIMGLFSLIQMPRAGISPAPVERKQEGEIA